MLNKKGFSLIEVIACIAMIGILAGSAVSLAGQIKYANTKKCVKVLNQKVETARMTAMTKKGEWNMFIYRGEVNGKKGLYYQIIDSSDIVYGKMERIGDYSINVEYAEKSRPAGEVGGGGTVGAYKKLDNGFIKLQFEKSTGAFRTSGESTGLESVYDSIKLYNDGGKEYVIRFVEKTGKHYIE